MKTSYHRQPRTMLPQMRGMLFLRIGWAVCDTAIYWDVPGTDKAAFLSTINSSIVSYRVGLWYSHLATVIVWLDCQVNVGVALIPNRSLHPAYQTLGNLYIKEQTSLLIRSTLGVSDISRTSSTLFITWWSTRSGTIFLLYSIYLNATISNKPMKIS